MSERTFDVVVLGAGPAGEVAAGRLAEGGLEVAIVERELIGGECSYWACMPSKALLRPGEALAEARRVPGAREGARGELDAAAALARRDEVVHLLDDDGQLPWLEERGIALVRGHGRLDGERRVVVGDEVLAARLAVVVATGSAAALPPVEGLAEAQPWTNREATTAAAVPAELLVLGGGVVGVELAQAWSSLGARVTLLEGAPRLIGKEEPFASEQLETALRERGVDVRTGVEATRVTRTDGGVRLELAGAEAVEGDELLVGVGRTPRTDDIGLETIGLPAGGALETDQGFCALDPWLYAIGDVNGRELLTHQGKYQARLVADRILGRPGTAAPGHGGPPPRVIFTEPQVAAVGHTVASAEAAGLAVRAVDVDVNGTAGASFVGKGVAGSARLVVDERRRVIVGATFTGAEVAELLHAATIAITAEVPLERLWHAVPAFPTRSEVWLKLLESYGL